MLCINATRIAIHRASFGLASGTEPETGGTGSRKCVYCDGYIAHNQEASDSDGMSAEMSDTKSGERRVQASGRIVGPAAATIAGVTVPARLPVYVIDRFSWGDRERFA